MKNAPSVFVTPRSSGGSLLFEVVTLESRTITTTRRQLHAIAENFIAGPQYRATGTIRMTARPDGFVGAAVGIAVVGATLRWPKGQAPLSGPVTELIRATGLDVGPPPASVYQPTAPLDPDEVLDMDPDAAHLLHRAVYAGHLAVKAFIPEQDPILWPEHFDVGVAEDEVNFGVSPGDDYHSMPYAYVAPWTARAGAFWNAPFGALHAFDFEAAPETMTEDIIDFFRRSRSQL